MERGVIAMKKKEECFHNNVEIESYELNIPDELIVIEKCLLCGKRMRTVYMLVEKEREEV